VVKHSLEIKQAKNWVLPKNRKLQPVDVSLFLELEEELGLIGKITLCLLCRDNSAGFAHIFISEDELLALMLVSFRKMPWARTYHVFNRLNNLLYT